jgi:putative FmdB family regulatory protein
MPIYEFRCQNCGNLLEIICRSGEEEVCLQCPECGGEELERVLSRVTHTMSDGSQSQTSGPQLSSRECSAGSCSTITLPGHTK